MPLVPLSSAQVSCQQRLQTVTGRGEPNKKETKPNPTKKTNNPKLTSAMEINCNK